MTNETNIAETTNEATTQTESNEATTTEAWSEEKTQEQVAEENKAIALKQEREKRKELENKLQEFEKEKADLIEKEKIKKWKHEEVINEQKTRLQELEWQLNELSAIKEEYTKLMDWQLQSEMWKIPEAKKDFVQKAISWKSFSEQMEFVKEFSSAFWDYTANTSPWKNLTGDKTSAFEQAKATWDISQMLKNAPTITK